MSRKKIVILIALFVVSFIFLNTTEVLVAQRNFDPVGFYANQEKQAQEAQQRAAIIKAVCVGVGVFLIAFGIHFYIKERDKKQREWQEKRDAEMKKALDSKTRENSSSDTSNRNKVGMMLFLCFTLSLLSGCGGGNKAMTSGQSGGDNQHPTELVGVWANRKGGFELVKDGTALLMGGNQGMWKVENSRLHLISPDGETLLSEDYAVSGSTLTIAGRGQSRTLRGGKIGVLTKAEADEMFASHGKNAILDYLEDIMRVKTMQAVFQAGGGANIKFSFSDAEGESIRKNLEYFVSKGADVHAKDSSDNAPIHLAAMGGNVEVVKFLVSKGADVNTRSWNGATPLVHAKEDKNTAMVEYLESVGAKSGKDL
ncbi:MAG: ankyrin repeat domain-containing protein [Planctomycetaceae bacterium]|jgi:hypothetical protein|nr:ankyrin repeat domain-containing protein [Planctomycetaceae bacterium]